MTEPTDREVEAMAKAIHDELWPGAPWLPEGLVARLLLKPARTILRREAALVEALERAERRLRKQVNIPLLNPADPALVQICRETADNIALAVSVHRAATPPEPTLAEAVEALFASAPQIVYGTEPLDVDGVRLCVVRPAPLEALRAALAREQERGK